jgi:hypothetical protein
MIQTITGHRSQAAAAGSGRAAATGTQVAGAALALAVSAVHVTDQGSLTALVTPDWIGWSYRLIETGGAATALVLLATVIFPSLYRLGWAVSVLLGAGPFLAYLTSRTVGVPGDAPDVGNWVDWTGTTSLLLEAGVIVLGISLLLAWRQQRPGLKVG